MIYGDWQPTMNLRFVERMDGAFKILQQCWRRETIEYREYGGKERRCVGSQVEWRDVPLARETGAEHGN